MKTKAESAAVEWRVMLATLMYWEGEGLPLEELGIRSAAERRRLRSMLKLTKARGWDGNPAHNWEWTATGLRKAEEDLSWAMPFGDPATFARSMGATKILGSGANGQARLMPDSRVLKIVGGAGGINEMILAPAVMRSRASGLPRVYDYGAINDTGGGIDSRSIRWPEKWRPGKLRRRFVGYIIRELASRTLTVREFAVRQPEIAQMAASVVRSLSRVGVTRDLLDLTPQNIGISAIDGRLILIDWVT